MDHNKKLEFVHKMAKLGLQHFDAGGVAGALGIGNNYNPVNAWGNNAQATPQNFQPAIAAGQNNYTAANTGLTNLAGSLTAQANGAGPNLANNELQSATNQNIATGAGMVASQKGISPALAATTIANQTANANQTAAGQAGALRGQQQLSAEQAEGNVLGTQIAGANTNQGIQQQGQASQNADITQATTAQSGQAGSIAGQNAQTNQGLFGGALNAASSLAPIFAKGGIVNRYADGGLASKPANPPSPPPSLPGAQSVQDSMRKAFHFAQGGGFGSMGKTALQPLPYGGISLPAGNGLNLNSPTAPTKTPNPLDGATPISGADSIGMVAAANGGQIQHGYLNWKNSKKSAMPESLIKNLTKGGKVKADIPQEKAKVPDNSYSNDTIPAELSEDEIVLPRSVTTHPQAPKKAAEFVRKELAKRKVGMKRA